MTEQPGHGTLEIREATDADWPLVQEGGKPVGVVTRQDLLSYLATR
jgi:hypothetical protein